MVRRTLRKIYQEPDDIVPGPVIMRGQRVGYPDKFLHHRHHYHHHHSEVHPDRGPLSLGPLQRELYRPDISYVVPRERHLTRRTRTPRRHARRSPRRRSSSRGKGRGRVALPGAVDVPVIIRHRRHHHHRHHSKEQLPDLPVARKVARKRRSRGKGRRRMSLSGTVGNPTDVSRHRRLHHHRHQRSQEMLPRRKRRRSAVRKQPSVSLFPEMKPSTRHPIPFVSPRVIRRRRSRGKGRRRMSLSGTGGVATAIGHRRRHHHRHQHSEEMLPRMRRRAVRKQPSISVFPEMKPSTRHPVPFVSTMIIRRRPVRRRRSVSLSRAPSTLQHRHHHHYHHHHIQARHPSGRAIAKRSSPNLLPELWPPTRRPGLLVSPNAIRRYSKLSRAY